VLRCLLRSAPAVWALKFLQSREPGHKHYLHTSGQRISVCGPASLTFSATGSSKVRECLLQHKPQRITLQEEERQNVAQGRSTIVMATMASATLPPEELSCVQTSPLTSCETLSSDQMIHMRIYQHAQGCAPCMLQPHYKLHVILKHSSHAMVTSISAADVRGSWIPSLLALQSPSESSGHSCAKAFSGDFLAYQPESWKTIHECLQLNHAHRQTQPAWVRAAAVLVGADAR
jgi:hypothetical protein